MFFALIFPLMFLVLFGGLFGDQSQSKVDLIEVGKVSVIDDLPGGAREAFEDTFQIERVRRPRRRHRQGAQGRRRRRGGDATATR